MKKLLLTSLILIAGANFAKVHACDTLWQPNPPTDTIICHNGAVTLSLGAATGGSTNSYLWQQSPNGSSWAPAATTSGVNTNRNFTTPGLSGNMYYRRRVISGCDETDTIISTPILVRRATQPIQQPDLLSTTICHGDSHTFTLGSATGGSGKFTYQWERWINEDNQTDIVGATDTNFTTPSLTNTTHYRRIARDIVCGLRNNSSVAMVTVRPQLQITAPLSEQPICHDGTTVLTVSVSGGSGNRTYQWQQSADSVSGWTNITTGGTTANYMPMASTTTMFYHLVVTDINCGTVISPIFTVHPAFDAGAIVSTNQTVCFHELADTIRNMTNAFGGDGKIEYRWRRNAVIVEGATRATLTPSVNTHGTFTYTREARDGTCRTGWVASTGTSTLIVRPQFTPGVIASPGQAVTLNDSADTIRSITNASGGDNNIEYRWKRNGVIVEGATDATHIPLTNVAGTFVYTREARDGACDTTWTASFGAWTLVVTASFEISIDGANPICIGTTTRLRSTVDGTWSSNDTNVASITSDGLVTGLSSGTTTFTFIQADTEHEAITPLIAVSSDRAPATNNGIDVIRDPAGTPYLLVFPNVAGNFFYQWYRNDTLIVGANSQFLYAANGLQHGEYRVFVAYARSESCGSFTDPITIGSQPVNASPELFFLYPNPSDGRFTVVFNRTAIGDQTAVTVGLFSLQGTRIMEQQIVGSENFEVDENLNRGIYVLRVTTDSNLSETVQIIINN